VTSTDDVAVPTLSIPGTHHSCCVDGPLGLAKTQDLDLPDQLTAGIRFLDIRLAHYDDDLVVHHDVVGMGKSYADVLSICSDFLRQNPSETIMMSVEDESRLDSTLGKFAPSQLWGKLSRGDTTKGDENTRSFEQTFKARTWEHVGDAPLFYNFTAAPPGRDSVATGPAFTSETRLAEVRGKIVLLRRFDGEQDMGSTSPTGQKTSASEARPLLPTMSNIAIRTRGRTTSSISSSPTSKTPDVAIHGICT
jgi:hypothetical protein